MSERSLSLQSLDGFCTFLGEGWKASLPGLAFEFGAPSLGMVDSTVFAVRSFFPLGMLVVHLCFVGVGFCSASQQNGDLRFLLRGCVERVILDCV